MIMSNTHCLCSGNWQFLGNSGLGRDCFDDIDLPSLLSSLARRARVDDSTALASPGRCAFHNL